MTADQTKPTAYRILVAEKQASICVVLNALLVRGGFKVLVTRSGAEALDLARKKEFDLAIVDTDLSDVHGLAVCSSLWLDSSSKILPILLSSAWPDTALLAAGVGAVGFVEKPHGYAHLAQLIRQYLDLLPVEGPKQAAAKVGEPFFA